VGALVEFVVLKRFGTSPFFFIVGMCLFDVVAGYTITIITAKRDVSVAPHDHGNDY
jgi:F0F1-type ATP synthase assembly protein I